MPIKLKKYIKPRSVNTFKGEYTVQDLMAIFEESLNDLKGGAQSKIRQRVYKQNLKSYFLGLDHRNQALFKTSSGTTPGVWWYQTIRFLDLKVAKKIQKSGKKLGSKEMMNLVIFGDLAVYCNDPSFKWWGYEYMAWKRQYGLHKQTIFPKIRNPRLNGTVCKHLYSVFNVLPFFINKIAGLLQKKGLI